MDKELILAVAGSGKTSLIVSRLNLEERFLLITYTINNTRNLKKSIIEKFGHFPNNIELLSYYNFLYSFCLRPFLAYKIKPRGIFWENTPKYTDRFKLDDIRRYMTKGRMLYHNRIAKLLQQAEILDDINNRLTKYYDHLLIDEVQDFAGHDFNLLINILKSDINLLLVGDFHQHTFDTSRDGRTNSTLHDDFDKYQERFTKQKIEIDKEHLNKSYRCTKNVCEFITENLGINIESHKDLESIVSFVSDKDKIMEIFEDDSIIKLFYRENYKYQCYSRNWGDCKGENHYNNVCVVLNKTSMDKYEKGKLSELKPVSKNKLYVACSRANNNLYLIDESEIKHLKK
ncbi:AAA family ATPase [Bizionia sp.]|uniref:AAA family ATPase n=1 Tax=Bizionia sp. TaxID=1954480 RepID=UPI003A917B53